MSLESASSRSPESNIPIQDREITLSDGTIVQYASLEPKEVISHVPVLYVGGFAQGTNAYSDELQSIAASGRRTFFINPLKGTVLREDEDRQTLDELNIPQVMQHKVGDVLALLDQLHIEQANLVGTSQGAAIAALVTVLRPELAKNLILLNPSGLQGTDTSLRISASTVLGDQDTKTRIRNQKTQGRTEQQQNEYERLKKAYERKQAHSELTHEILWRVIHEIPSITGTDITPVLEIIKEYQMSLPEEARTRISLITANKDRTFEPQKIEQNLGVINESGDEYTDTLNQYIDRYAMYVDKEGGHQEPMLGKAGLITQILNQK